MYMYMYMCIYIYIYMYTYIQMYIYTYCDHAVRPLTGAPRRGTQEVRVVLAPPCSCSAPPNEEL